MTQAGAGEIGQLVELIARCLVDRPDEVAVNEVEDDQGLRIELRVAGEDLGKVIGKQGRTARSIRTLVAAAGDRRQRKVNLEIVE